MNNDFLVNLESLERERGIDHETLIALVEESLESAARKAVCATRDLHVQIDRKTGAIQCLAKLFVVDIVEHPEEEIAISAARVKYPEVRCGDEIEWEVTPENFGRIAAQTAKQVIMQRLRQVEKRNICDVFKDQLMQLVNGEVRRVERGEVILSIGTAEGMMRHSDRIPGEDYEPGDLITALLVEINADKPGPSLYVSRSHPEFVARLFEREVSEISEGLVQIKAVSREAGYRSKIAVSSKEPRVDPVGACVGLRGTRVKTIVRELGGEKVDILQWDSDVRVFVTNALKPAKIARMEVNTERKSIRIEVQEDQLSLAIGKKGQNARLASKLTGWRIDIQRAAELADNKVDDFEERVRRAIDSLAKVAGIGPEAAAVLVANGFASLEGIVAGEETDIAELPGLNADRATEIMKAAQDALGV